MKTLGAQILIFLSTTVLKFSGTHSSLLHTHLYTPIRTPPFPSPPPTHTYSTTTSTTTVFFVFHIPAEILEAMAYLFPHGHSQPSSPWCAETLHIYQMIVRGCQKKTGAAVALTSLYTTTISSKIFIARGLTRYILYTCIL